MCVNIRRKEKKDSGRIKSNFTSDVKFNQICSDYGWPFWGILRSGSHKNHYRAPDLNFYTFKGPELEIRGDPSHFLHCDCHTGRWTTQTPIPCYMGKILVKKLNISDTSDTLQ